MKYSFLLLLVCAFSCKDKVESVQEPEPEPRTRDEIFADRINVVSLYMSSSGEQRRGPGGKGYFAEGGKVFWPVMECANLKCPGRHEIGSPHIFVIPDPGVVVLGSNKLSYDVDRARAATNNATYYGCRKCVPLRIAWVARSGLGEETWEQKELYEGFAVPHELPESKKQLADFNAEMVKRVQWEKRQKAKKESE